MELITLLLNPKIIAVIGPVGAILLGVVILLFKLYKYERNKKEQEQKKNDELQESRLKESQEMQKDYYELAADMDKTLNAVLKAIRPKNGNGNGSK